MYQGALFLAGVDAQNNVITLKVDRSGTRVLNGPDGNGKIIKTPVTCCETGQVDFDPLLPLFQSYSGSGGAARIRRIKQVAFSGADLNNLDYVTTAMFLPVPSNYSGSKPTYYLNKKTNRLESYNGYSARWLAKSNDPAIGEFVFSFGEHRFGVNGEIYYQRKFKDADNKEVSTAGGITLPPLPGLTAIDPYSGYVGYDGFENGSIVISPDGLTVSGFIWNVGENGKIFEDIYELRISLAAVPTVTLERVNHLPLGEELPGERIDISEQTGSPSGDSYTSFSHKLFTRNSRRKYTVDFIGYFNGKPIVAKNESTSSSTFEEKISFEQNITTTSTSCPGTRTTSSSRDNKFVDTSTSTRIGSLSGIVATTGTYTNVPKEKNYSLQGTYVKRVETDARCVSTQPPPEVNEVRSYDPRGGPATYVGKYLYAALTDKPDDVIFRDEPTDYSVKSDGTPNLLRFRGHTFDRFDYIADASPLGEVFIASPDLKFMLHEPKPGGMQKVVIPKNMVKLIGAFWQ